MPSESRQRLTLRALTSLAVGGALVLTAAALPARADAPITPTDQQVVINGAGWGHGKGLSQYGAAGAAKAGLKYDKILSFYYTGTTLGSLPAGNGMRVLITADNDAKLHVRPVAGQVVKDTAGKSVTLPTGTKYSTWRILFSGNKRLLQYRKPTGGYVTYKNKLDPARSWFVSNPKTGTVKLSMPNGSVRTYSGRLVLVRNSSGTPVVVNYLSMESYLRGVVASEMPASWSSEALKAQAVAARTYAAKERASKTKSAYDICDTSSCQVYKDNSARYASTDAAIKATANRVVLYKGQLTLTQFSSSNGGWAADYSGVPYLAAKQDPYDPVKTWTVTLSSKALQKAYPSIGTFTSIQVTKRTGVGPFSGRGRVSSIKITGTAGSVTVSGGSFKTKFGLRETLFYFSPPAVANILKRK